jgi:hypothetical protein
MAEKQINTAKEFNKIGWHALQHKDGWWVGTDEGVVCYEDHEMARIALTILWQRDGGQALNYIIKVFTGADTKAGEHTPKFTAEEAIKRYEPRKRRR